MGTVRDTTPIVEWWQQFEFLNPNWRFPVEFEGATYSTIRQAWEASKTTNPEERCLVEKMFPGEAVRWGTQVVASREWEEHNEDWLFLLLAQKFGLLNPTKESTRLAYLLVCTNPRPLVYRTYMCDVRLGVCLCPQHKDAGNNLLGESLEAIRERVLPEDQALDMTATDCDWCFWRRKYLITPAEEMIVYFKNGHLVRLASCSRHRGAFAAQAQKEADRRQYCWFPISDTPGAAPTPVQQSFRPALPPASPPMKPTWGVLIITTTGQEADVMGAI